MICVPLAACRRRARDLNQPSHRGLFSFAAACRRHRSDDDLLAGGGLTLIEERDRRTRADALASVEADGWQDVSVRRGLADFFRAVRVALVT
jgi:hypothetical protein